MKKITFILALSALPAMAHQITPAEALSRAMESQTALKAVPYGRAATTAYDFVGSYGSLYVFNRADSEGFLITSSDSRLRPVYAVSTCGRFTADEIPPAMKWLFGQYEEEAKAAAEDGGDIKVPDYYVGWEVIEPLVKAKWDQGSPYNDRCPVVYNQRTLTGCVATAMAQIIYTHRYAKGSGQISYQLYIDNSTQTFDFSQAKFDFASMTDTYDSKTPAAAREAVAELMEACGKSVKMSYNPGSSGAISDHVPVALQTYFGYDPYTTICNRKDYQTEQWETIIYNELKAGRPVFYSGSTDQYSGHAFVCDGYDGNGLYHINWGWSGMSDGFFALPSLKPGQVGSGAQPGGFNNVQQMVVIAPPGSGDLQNLAPETPAGQTDITITDVEMSPLCAGEEASMTFTAVNRGNLDLITISARLLLYDSRNNIVAYGNEVVSYSVTAGDASRSTFRITLADDKGNSIKPGDYNLHISGSDDNPISADAVFPVTVTDDHLPKDEFTHSGQVSVGNAKESIPDIIFKGQSFHLSPSLRNDNANAKFTIGLALFQPGTDSIVWSDTQSMTCQNTNGQYLGGFPYLKNYTVSIPAGIYDAAFISDGNKIISARRTGVKVAELIGNLAFTTDKDGKGASLVPLSSYRGNIVIPESVTLSDGRTLDVTSVEAETFQDLNAVTSIDFPSTLTSMGMHSLRYARNIETIRFRGDHVPFVHIAAVAYRINPYVRIHVNPSAIDDYATAVTPFVPEVYYPDGYIPVSELTLDRSEMTMVENSTARLTATTLPGNATEKTIRWKSSDETVATVDSNGNVHAIAAGSAVITASADAVKATCSVTVEKSSAIQDITVTDAEEAPLTDMLGRRVTNPVRGQIYIRNGQKFRLH